MKTTVVMLLLLGCDCDGIACEYIRTVSGDWASIESCEAAHDQKRLAFEMASYPLVIAQCIIESRDMVPLQVSGSALDAKGAKFIDAQNVVKQERWGAFVRSIPGRVVRHSVDWMGSIALKFTSLANEQAVFSSGRALSRFWN